MPDDLIKLANLSFAWGEKVILKDINLSIPRGSVVAIMGPSGVGKTTVLRLITGQLSPTKGTVEVDGMCVSSMSHKNLYKMRRNIGVLLQNGALFTDLDVFENVAVPVREHSNLPEALIRRLVLIKLEAVGLRGAVDLMPSELSGGMARRVALARASVLDPSLMLYDEPLAGLDPIGASTILRLIRDTNDAMGMTSVVITHSVEDMMELADYAYIIASQSIVGQGTPEQLRENTDPRVVQFLNGEIDGPVPFHYPASDLHQDLLG
ncbi:MAG: ABC transporter ATP-binding protein [Xanthomonadales bacterium]|nr:ABC transporter ATP-binding protein [Xanthomonadales bacterium]